MMEFMRELQWQCYNKHQLEVFWMEKEQALVYRYGVEDQPKPEETPLIYFAADVPVGAYEGDRDEFIGPYRSEENPIGLEQEALGNSLLKGGDPCFALQLELELKAGEETGFQCGYRRYGFPLRGVPHGAGCAVPQARPAVRGVCRK